MVHYHRTSNALCCSWVLGLLELYDSLGTERNDENTQESKENKLNDQKTCCHVQHENTKSKH